MAPLQQIIPLFTFPAQNRSHDALHGHVFLDPLSNADILMIFQKFVVQELAWQPSVFWIFASTASYDKCYHLKMKSWNAELNSSAGSVGIGSLTIMFNSSNMAKSLFSLLHSGNLPMASSMRVRPKLQMSLLIEYIPPVILSGDM